MSASVGARSRKSLELPFHNVRNISSPEDQDNNRKVYVGQAPVRAILDLPTDENVRDYLVDAEGKQRRRPNQVHKAIRDTLENNPQNFTVLNSGVVIVARACEVNEKEKRLHLVNPSIINGSQTQGVIRDFYAENGRAADLEESASVHIKFEVIVTDNEDLIAETSIARNFQTDVMTISIAGRLGQLDELEEAFQAKRPGSKLQKSETKLSDDYVKTERLLQFITALIPEELWPKPGDVNKVYTYSMKAKCLKDFQDIYKKAHDPKDPEHSSTRDLYQFYLDIAAQAQELYEHWKIHQGFQGTGLRCIQREGRDIVDVPDGIIFPILAALSAFAVKGKSGWEIKPPSLFNEAELIRAACSAFKDIANHNPWTMGKSKACYSALAQITHIYKKLAAARR